MRRQTSRRLGRRSRWPVPLIGAFESTYQPALDVDGMESTEHDRRWEADLRVLVEAGVRRVRYPVRWHRVEPEPETWDWRATDRVLGWMRDNGLVPIVDLLHHTSYPGWLTGFTDPRFGAAYLRYTDAVARRYPWIEEYTLCNEPMTNCVLSGQEGLWPPHLRGLEGFLAIARATLPVVAEASRRWRDLLPHGRHVHVEVCERHSGATADGARYATFANDRRFFLLDLLLGRPIERDRPFVAAVLEAGGDDLLSLEPGHVDVLGLDYYAHCQWEFTSAEGEGRMCSSRPAPLAALLVEYAERYQRPVILGETNIRGYASDRASWLKYTLEQCELARDAGVDLQGYCWFPTIDSCDWSSVLCRCERDVDPVGVYWLDDAFDRRTSCMSEAWERVARGTTAADLPAYRFREPVATWLRGWSPQMSHWDWREPVVVPHEPVEPPGPIELRIPDVVE